MKNTPIPLNTRYIPLTQQRWCCVPTCIQMVMIRHSIPLLPAELIGYHLGLIVPEDAQELFWNPRTGEKPGAGFGTQAGKAEYGPNAVFKKLNIPLMMTWSLINNFPDLETFQTYLIQRENMNTDTLVCFDWASLFEPSWKEHNGHVCVLDRVFSAENSVRLIDPDPFVAKWRTVSIDQLYQAMKVHGKEHSGGFWELSLKQ